ncbi:MAG: diaminopimelate decarboxylase [Ignavibacteria bacterium]|nr:diaminopimelate decarboxylase [Ignavibacteria bacterium]
MYFSAEQLAEHKFFSLNGIEKLKPFIENYKSPVYVYSRDVITSQYNDLKKYLPPAFSIFYAQKSNPNIEILKHIHALGAGCDTASLGEMKSAITAGFKSGQIMLTGPGKTEEEIKFAVENNILSINAESLQELETVNKIAGDCGKKQDILVRINPPFDASETTRIIGGSGVSKFGIDIEQIPQFIEHSRGLKNINLNGIHIFNSSQILDVDKIYNNTAEVINTAMKLCNDFGITVKRIDLGGGFGIPYASGEKEIDLSVLGKKLSEFLSKKEVNAFLKDVNLVFELGRFLSGQSGIYLTKVLYTKESRGTNIAITDGGIHHLVRPALIGQKHPVVNITGILENRKGNSKYLIAGPLCTSLDEFDGEALITEIKQGDILAVLNAGAYGYTESMPYFLSHKPAGEEFIN